MGYEDLTALRVRVVVLASADPDFFIAHADVNLILRIPASAAPPAEPSFFQAMVDRFRTMPKATIAKIPLPGPVRRGGSNAAWHPSLAKTSAARAPSCASGPIPVRE